MYRRAASAALLALAAMAVLLASVLTPVALAFGVTIDGNSSEWSSRLPIAENLGIVVRDGLGRGEYVWRDADNDVRLDLGAAPEQDLRELHVTGSPTHLYILARTGGADLSKTPQVQIAVDLDLQPVSGQQFLAGFAETSVSPQAQWEYLIQTHFAASPPGLGARVLDTSFLPVAEVPAQRNSTTGEIEMGVPWSALGLLGPPTAPLRLTVTTFVSANSDDDTVDIGGTPVSNALDSLSDCGAPRSSGYPNAWACDLSDGVADYFVDVWFSPTGEVYAPLLVSRFVANAAPGASEWIEVRNVSPLPLDLTNYKLGDQEAPDAASSEGMARFPAGALLAPGGTFIVAESATAFATTYGVPPDAELANSSPGTPDMVGFTLWAAGTVALANAGDAILLLDPSNTILDVVTFGTGSYAGVTAFSAAPTAGQIVARTPLTQDTDNNQVDFVASGTTLATRTPTSTLTLTPTPTRTPTATRTATPTGTATATPSITPSPTATSTTTGTSTPTRAPTPTATATIPVGATTSTPTRTATPFPRPGVGVQAVPDLASHQLRVTLTARDAGCAPNNQLQTLRFTALANATVNVPGAGTVTAPSITPIPLAAQPPTLSLSVQRVASEQPITVELTITDGCGVWPTFVGGGPGAF